MRRIKVHPKHASEARAVQDGTKIRLLTLSDLDLRTTASRRCRELINSVHADLSGTENLSTGERLLVQRAAMIAVISEDVEAKYLLGEQVDVAMLCTLTNATRRVFESLGLKRRARTVPNLAEYIQATVEGDADDAG